MGFFKKLKKSVSSIGKNPVGAILGGGIGSAALGPLGGVVGASVGGSSSGSLSDLLLGKKSKDIQPDDIANQIRATQSKGLGELNSALDQSGEGVVRNQAALESKGVLTAAQDARRNAQRMMAQTGLRGTSLGLASNRSIDQTAGQNLASINAQLPGQIRNQQIQDAQTRIGAGNVNQNGMNFNTIQGTRSGGILGVASTLAPLAGSMAGAYKDYQTGGLAAKRAGAY
jgi:hypothetical protein